MFDYNWGDVYACVADIGWITGHSYVVYGPLANGATTVLFESIPTYPDPGNTSCSSPPCEKAKTVPQWTLNMCQTYTNEKRPDIKILNNIFGTVLLCISVEKCHIVQEMNVVYNYCILL